MSGHNGEDQGQEIGDLLRRLPPPPSYPSNMKTARKGEYVAHARKLKKKPGCPLMRSIILILIWVVYQIF